MFLETKCIAGSPGCHGNHSNMATRECCNNLMTWKYLKLIFMMFFVAIDIDR